jgi:hypothetical protein
MQKDLYKALRMAALVTVGAVAVVLVALPLGNTHLRRKDSQLTYARLQVVSTAIEAFVKEHGPISGSENSVITAILAGQEGPKSAREHPFLNPPPEWLDETGNLVDVWASPLVFDTRRGDGPLIIRSCGPNRKDDGGDADDISVRGREVGAERVRGLSGSDLHKRQMK